MRPPGRKLLSSIGAALFWLGAGLASASGPLEVRPGAPFPDLRFDGLVDPGDYHALGIPRSQGPFTLSEVAGDVLLLEFFNKACVPCQHQVRAVEAFFEDLAARGLEERIRVLAVAAGNQAKYLPPFRAKRGLRFP